MKIIADFHIHSRYSRATSKSMVIPEIARMAKIKGIDIVGTGDFTHPEWFRSLKKELSEMGNGLYKAKNVNNSPYFILTSEISLIYKYKEKTRKIHIVVMAPDLKTVDAINKKLSSIGNIYSDGRPILGLNAIEFVKIILDINPNCLIMPAHIWTPWFSLFGSKSGFDTIKQCFEKYSQYIFSGETGLSSDPEMNWRLSMLDNITLLSNSDAHSPGNLGREANVFEIVDKNISYKKIYDLIKNARSKSHSKATEKLLYTIEFYPEEGKYHFDGHSNCHICMTPAISIKNKLLCPKCGRALTIGVYHQVEKMADRPAGFTPKHAPGSKHIVPLEEIISEYLQVGKKSKKVQCEYERILNELGSEFSILLDIDKKMLTRCMDEPLALGIMNARSGKIKAFPGYDGIYGKIQVFSDKIPKGEYQKTLFES